MSRRKSTTGSLLAYTNKDFNQADRLNKIRMYMIEPGKWELDGEDWDYFMLLEGCFHLCQSELSKQVAINKIKVAYPTLTHHSAVMAFHNCNELFGDLVENNRKIQKGKLIERLAILADKAFEKAVFIHEEKDENGEVVNKVEHCNEDWFEIYRKLSADIAKLENYDQPAPPFDPAKIQIPKLIITSDPEAFRRSQKAELNGSDT